ncbi:MAG TPA: hypothetical protein QF624_06465 [Dehalococcoidia bacterium]|nr:hypothetical protein [Dehalococcoidia bacterium]
MEVSGWLERLMPDVHSADWRDGCWVGHVKMRSAEHHPPLHWLGRALDSVDAAGAIDVIGEQLSLAHEPEACAGWSEADQRVQDALTEACAIAWAAGRLGRPEPVQATDGRLLIHVPSVDACVAPRRLWPVRTMEDLLGQVREHIDGAAAALPDAAGRISYVDINLEINAFGRMLGHDGQMTEPLRESLKFVSQERGVGWVLTRPFEWGVPLEEWY